MASFHEVLSNKVNYEQATQKVNPGRPAKVRHSFAVETVLNGIQAKSGRPGRPRSALTQSKLVKLHKAIKHHFQTREVERRVSDGNANKENTGQPTGTRITRAATKAAGAIYTKL